MVAVELSKIVVVIVNLVFMIFGLAVLILGILFKFAWDDVRDAFDDKSKDLDFNLQEAGDTLGIACIVFGAFILILSLLGCIGGCCRIRVLLVVYAVVVIIILIAQVAVVTYVAVKGNDDEITKALKDSMYGYKEDSSDDDSKAWSAVFSTLECCGVKNTSDFNNTNFEKSKLRIGPEQKASNIPVTCCKGVNYEDPLTDKVFKDAKVNKCLTTGSSDVTYTKGCETKVRDYIDDNKGILIGVGITIFIIELIVVIIAFFLCCRHDD